jgi:GNAT superfamily N-acetyltransferase
MEIRKLTPPEIPEALRLVWETFQEFEAPDYSHEGVRKFKECIDDAEFISRLVLYGAFLDGVLAGIAATRQAGSHVALFFVRSTVQRRGIGRKLFEHMVLCCPDEMMTVNSSPYAVPAYLKLGFVPSGPEQTTDGIRFTPMSYHKYIS